MGRFRTALVVTAPLGASGSDDSRNSAATTESSASKPAFDSCDAMWRAEEPSSPGLRISSDLEPLGAQPRRVPYEEPNPDELNEHSLADDEVTSPDQFPWQAGLDGFLQVARHQDEIHDLGLALVDETLKRMNWINSTPSPTGGRPNREGDCDAATLDGCGDGRTADRGRIVW